MKDQPLKTPKKYAITIIPITALSLSRDPFFTYEYPEIIETGSLVRIPFGKQQIRGIVFESKPLTKPLPFKTRPVRSILMQRMLTKEQLDLAQYISSEYFTPIGIVLKHFIPKPVTERTTKNFRTKIPLAPVSLTPAEQKLLVSFSRKKRAHYLPHSLAEKEKIFVALAAKTITENNSQILLLVPDMLLAQELFEKFSCHFERKSLALLTSSLSHGAYFTHFEAIRSGQARIIIGTRQALFAPYEALATVLLDFDGHDGYKQWDMLPRYEGRSVAGHLASLCHARFITVSPAPNIRTLFEEEFIALPILGKSIFDDPKSKRSIILSDLKLDRYKKNFSPFSLLTLDHIRETMRQGRSILLIVNRQGTSVFSVCEHCKNILRCPDCDRALIGTDSGNYRCLHCRYHTKEFPSCPSCGGINFKNMGFGTEKLERDLRRLFAHTHIRRLDAMLRRSKRKEETMREDAASGRIDMLIGTEATLLAPSLPNLGLIVMLDGDNALRFPEYRSEERFIGSIALALSRIRSEANPGKLIIQTFHSEHAIFRALTDGTISEIQNTLQQDRKLFGYPPYGTILKCSIQNTDEKKVEQEILDAKQLLETHKDAPEDTYIIRGPITPLSPKTRGKYSRFIVIQTKPGDIPQTLRTSLEALFTRGFTIDREPLSLS